MGFGGIVYTDSMSMDAVAKMVTADEGAVRALLAGADQVLHAPESDRRVQRDQEKRWRLAGIGQAQLDASVTRVLRAKASVGLHVARTIDLDAVPANIAAAQRTAVADEAFAACDHAREGLSPPGAARGAARHLNTLSLGARLSVGMADRGAEPHVHSGAEEALAASDLDRGVRSHADVGARSWCAPSRRATAPSSRRCSCGRRPAAAGSTSVRNWCACCAISRGSP